MFPCHMENELSFPHTSVVLCSWPLKSQPREKEFTPPTCTAASLGEKTLCSESNCWGKKIARTLEVYVFLSTLVFHLNFLTRQKDRQDLFCYSVMGICSNWEMYVSCFVK